MTTEKSKNTSVAAISEPRPNLEESIRRRAYELYEQRGREDGHDVDDWVRAPPKLPTPPRNDGRLIRNPSLNSRAPELCFRGFFFLQNRPVEFWLLRCSQCRICRNFHDRRRRGETATAAYSSHP